MVLFKLGILISLSYGHFRYRRPRRGSWLDNEVQGLPLEPGVAIHEFYL